MFTYTSFFSSRQAPGMGPGHVHHDVLVDELPLAAGQGFLAHLAV